MRCVMNAAATTMTTTTTLNHVREAVGMEWPGFEARHPKLAGVGSREALEERLSEHLAGDPEYQRALAEAREAGMADVVVAQLQTQAQQDFNGLVGNVVVGAVESDLPGAGKPAPPQ